MTKLEQKISKANGMIDAAHDLVTAYVRQVLVKNGIPSNVAEKYSVNSCTGGEWVLDNETGDLAMHDCQLYSEEYIVKTVRDIENGDIEL